MTGPDPFARLGLGATATAEQVRLARRELAKRFHPDVGGDAGQMRAINDAAAAALRAIAAAGTGPAARSASTSGTPERSRHGGRQPRDEVMQRDTPSFTVEALPVEAFEALLLAAAALGEVEDDDPPYGLDVLMAEPLACWCHLGLVPDAGASTVSLTVAPEPDGHLPPIIDVRDAWIAELNSLDWSALS
ncbi:MAG: J domain-containing protein [Actinomycetota bacterium]